MGEAGSLQEAIGEVRSTTTEEAVRLEAGPELPAKSETASEASLSTPVPSEQEVSVTVKEEPEDDEGANEQPVAVPALEKSAAVKPETLSEKVSV